MFTEQKIEDLIVCKCWFDTASLPPYSAEQIESARKCVLAAIAAVEAQHFSSWQQ